MKKRDKMKGKKGYAILALVIAISFITVLTWHNLVQASYKTKENAGSTSFPNNDKYTYVEVKGPSGTSTLKLQVTHSGSACKPDTEYQTGLCKQSKSIWFETFYNVSQNNKIQFWIVFMDQRKSKIYGSGSSKI